MTTRAALRPFRNRNTVARSWATSHLRRLSEPQLEAVVGVMPAWLQRRRWAPPEGEPELLWEFIDRHGLGGVLGSLVGAGLTPSGTLATLALDRYLSNSLHFERARKVCREIAAASERIGLPILNFKGPALAEQAYGDGGVRSFSDIDLWTESRAGALKLLGVLDARVIEDSDLGGPVRRIRAPGAILAVVDGWEMEIRYPTPEPTDPMLQLLAEFEDRWIWRCGLLAAPDATRHLLLLVLHMSWYHYWSRFIWFLDVAALMSRQRAAIDFDWLSGYTRRLRASNLSGIAASFCRRHIDPSIPELPLNRADWNCGILARAVGVDAIASGDFSLDQTGPVSVCRVLWLRILRHYLLSDPRSGPDTSSDPARWIGATAAWSLQMMAGRPLGNGLGRMAGALLYPAARITAWALSTNGGEL